MYTAPYYLLGLDLTLLGVWLICSASRERPVQFLLGCVFAACGTGVYQAYLCVALTIMLLYMMMSLRYDPADRRFRFFCKGLSLAGASLLILALYLAATRLALHLAGTELTDYESISSFGFSGWERYLDRVRRAYAEFFWPPAGKMRDMYPTAALYWLYEAVLSLGILLALDRAWQLFRAKKRRGIEFLFLLALFPLCVNFVHVMVDVQLVH
ncbi:MAG: glucosyltransferase domain-containing protein, partial [Pyramidobacter sp.]|nr:glucosyltransferase domain-containing protein [Pyramidobacter sp.]